MNVDRLSAFNTFVRVAESGSFSAVAREQGSTQSAVSKQVAALERHLGSKLLARSTRQLSLTEAGEQVLEQARRVLAEVAELENSLARGRQTLNGELRVAASVGFGRLHLLPLVQSFLHAHPEVRVDLRLHDGFVDLLEQGIDVSVRIGELPDSRLLARRIGSTRRQLMAHRSYLRKLPRGLKTPREPEDLLAHRCVVYTELQTRNAWAFTAGPGASATTGSQRTVRVGGNLQTNSTEVIRSAALAGMGIVYAPCWLLTDALASGEVQRLLPDWEAPALPIHLVSPPERRQSAKVRAFVEHVAENIGERLG
jgi:DNA-binding transcriptional LysR family regulator